MKQFDPPIAAFRVNTNAINLVEPGRGTLKLRKLITRTYRLDEINRGYADLNAG